MQQLRGWSALETGLAIFPARRARRAALAADRAADRPLRRHAARRRRARLDRVGYVLFLPIGLDSSYASGDAADVPARRPRLRARVRADQRRSDERRRAGGAGARRRAGEHVVPARRRARARDRHRGRECAARRRRRRAERRSTATTRRSSCRSGPPSSAPPRSCARRGAAPTSSSCRWPRKCWKRLHRGRFRANICSCRTSATILHADLDAFYASVEQRDDPRLRGRPGDRRRRRRARRELRGQGVRRAHRDGRPRRRGGCARTRSSCRRGCRPTPRRARRCSRSSTTRRPLVEGLSIDEAFLDVRGLRADRRARRRDRGAAARAVREQVGLPITVGVARTKFLAKVASGVAKPDGLLVVPPDGELAFLHPLPVERLWGVGPVTARKLHARGHHDGRRGRAARRGRAGRDARPRRPAATCTRSRTTATRGRSQVGRRRRSIGSQRALGRRAALAGEIDAVLVGLVDRVTRRMRARRPRRPHGRAAPALRRLLARDALAHAAAARPRDAADPRRGARAARRRAMPLIERQGLTLVGVAVDEPRRRRAPSSSRCRSTAQRAARSTPRSTRCASASARTRSRGRCCSAATGAVGAAAPD